MGRIDILGRSVEGRDIAVYLNFADFTPPAASGHFSLLIGGTHGDERATVPILENFISGFLETGRVANPVAVVALLNPDGYARDSRYNARGVDLNRNFPHHWSPQADEPPGEGPLSEPESRLLHDYILAHRPAQIVSLHWALGEIDADGPQSVPLAEHVWNALDEPSRRPYRLRLGLEADPSGEAFGGSLGQWCGHGLAYPDSPNSPRPAMITLELPHHPHLLPRPEKLPAGHFDSVRALWRDDSAAYLGGVQGAAHRMLEAACGFARGESVPAAPAGSRKVGAR